MFVFGYEQGISDLVLEVMGSGTSGPVTLAFETSRISGRSRDKKGARGSLLAELESKIYRIPTHYLSTKPETTCYNQVFTCRSYASNCRPPANIATVVAGPENCRCGLLSFP